MKLNLKERNGITLIALVITIIVLLILAGVVITTLTGDNGILGKAKTAKTTNDEEKAKEQIKIAVMGSYGKDGELNYDDLTKNLGQIGITELPDTASYPLEVTLDGVSATIEANGEVNFTTSGGYTQTGDTITSPDGKTMKVGDYVDYDPTLEAKASDLTYTSTADKTGADSDQEFNATTYKSAGYGWRILGVSNGKIRLISEEFIGAGTYTDSNRTYYTLKGQKGFINGIEELNKISAIFGHGKGAEKATSITVEDINAITGYNPTTAKYGEGNSYEYGNKVTYTRGEGTQNTFNYYDKTNKTFKALTSGSTEITSTYYYYYAGEFGKNNGTDGTSAVDDIYNLNETYKMLFGYDKVGSDNGFRNFTNGKCEQKYWLASDYAYAEPYFVKWGLRYVNDGYVNRNYLCDSGGYESSYSSYGVRPVVSLKSDVSLEWNETAKEWKIK
ncbi:MAG: type II secretion system protein [Clostridia bacterium]|jgi:hypothetical protein|nr:type II secretion system protein [Clostridia bacterium]